VGGQLVGRQTATHFDRRNSGHHSGRGLPVSSSANAAYAAETHVARHLRTWKNRWSFLIIRRLLARAGRSRCTAVTYDWHATSQNSSLESHHISLRVHYMRSTITMSVG